MNKDLRKKILRSEKLTPGEMVELMRYCREQVLKGIKIEQVYQELGIDPGESLIIS